MNTAEIVAALALPPDARVDQRVPKKLLLEQGAPTAADKRQIQNGVEEMLWIAALKPTNIGVPDYRDTVREYLEIAVLSAGLRPAAKPSRLVELIHRAIPYPVVLLTQHGETVSLSLAHKRWSQGEAGKTVLDGEVASVQWTGAAQEAHDGQFLAAVALARQPRAHLQAVYQGWLDCVTALAAARIAGIFAPPHSADRAEAMRNGLDAHARLERELASLRAQAETDKQLNRRVELNLEIKRLEAELAATAKSLEGNRR
jgi:hypothetical protein